ncbi:MAG: TetR/AcrR family transcriptional regulator [Angustibacter sp.]
MSQAAASTAPAEPVGERPADPPLGPPTSTRSRAPYHHGDLREALVAEALKQVRERGTEAVSLRGVAQAIGVSASAAYHHFPDKTTLMHEVCTRAHVELDRRMSAGVTRVRGRDRRAAVRRLEALGDAYIDFALDEPHLFRHAFGPYCTPPGSEQSDPQVRDDADGHSYDLMCQVLDDLDELGALRVREGIDLLVWTSVHGFAALALDMPSIRESRDVLPGTLLRVLLEPADDGT